MEPIKPEVRKEIIDSGRASAEEIEEYQKLLADRDNRTNNFDRIAELNRKLFGDNNYKLGVI